jgi:parvulin-like peptidyl-prolyl isomerase
MHRPHPRRELVIIGTFGLVLAVGLGSIGGAYLLYRSDHDWASVATVNGHDISRETLRGRMAVLSLLAQERSGYIGDAYAQGDVTADQATALRTQVAATTTLEAARQSLIDDELLRELAARDGIATPATPDAMAQGTTDAISDVAHRVRYVRFGLSTSATSGAATPTGSWPAASATNIDDATARVRTELSGDTPITTIVADLHDAGWQVFGEDVAVSAEGVPADASLELDPAIAAATVAGQVGDVVGPASDAYGRVALGKVLGTPHLQIASRRLSIDAYTAKLDTTALQQWANGQALKRAVTAHLLGGWTKSVTLAHFRELAIGAAPDSSGSAGPWVELSGLALDRLSGVAPSSIAGAPANLDLGADALAKTLKADSATDRATLFRSLVAAANKASAAGTTTSGEIGFYTKGQLTPEIGKAAFADSVHTGDVVGPITTSAGPQLFLVEARYSGTLDERAQVALQQVRADPAPDLAKYTTQFSPADVALATDAGWRAAPEFGPDEPVRAALFVTTIGTLSDPFVLDGKLAVAVVTERKTAGPDARTLARLTLDGYDAWFAAEYAKAKITQSDHPLPELEPSASPSPTDTPAPALPSAPVLDTPNVPVVPGQPAPTPVKTNALGLPVLP